MQRLVGVLLALHLHTTAYGITPNRVSHRCSNAFLEIHDIAYLLCFGNCHHGTPPLSITEFELREIGEYSHRVSKQHELKPGQVIEASVRCRS